MSAWRTEVAMNTPIERLQSALETLGLKAVEARLENLLEEASKPCAWSPGAAFEPFDADQMIELDIGVHHHEEALPVPALSTMADSLPGSGIVAAVLGVVVTIGALGGPPEEIGHNIAAALVGTFLGILLCYGFIGPVASNMARNTDEEHAYYHALRVVIVSSIQGSPPSIAVEFGRRAIPGHHRSAPARDEKGAEGGKAATRKRKVPPNLQVQKVNSSPPFYFLGAPADSTTASCH
jgi:hypothetical protein